MSDGTVISWYDATAPGLGLRVVQTAFPLPVNVVSGGASSVSTTGTPTSVASSAADGVILAANALRKGATVFNDSTAILYLMCGATVSSATVYTVQVQAGGYFEVPFNYVGIIRGIWAAVNGSARVTEFA